MRWWAGVLGKMKLQYKVNEEEVVFVWYGPSWCVCCINIDRFTHHTSNWTPDPCVWLMDGGATVMRRGKRMTGLRDIWDQKAKRPKKRWRMNNKRRPTSTDVVLSPSTIITAVWIRSNPEPVTITFLPPLKCTQTYSSSALSYGGGLYVAAITRANSELYKTNSTWGNFNHRWKRKTSAC